MQEFNTLSSRSHLKNMKNGNIKNLKIPNQDQVKLVVHLRNEFR